MVRGFSRLIFPACFFPRFGVEEGRCGSKVRGHVKEGPHFGGMNLPGLGPSNDSLGPRARGGGERARPFSRSFPQELEGGRSNEQVGARRWN